MYTTVSTWGTSLAAVYKLVCCRYYIISRCPCGFVSITTSFQGLQEVVATVVVNTEVFVYSSMSGDIDVGYITLLLYIFAK